MTVSQGTAGLPDNVYDLFSGRRLSELADSPFIRLAPELDGLEMLYSNTANPGKLFALKILCWGLRESGEVVGLVPWMSELMPCPGFTDPLDGRFEGYYDPGIDETFFTAPEHKVLELESSADYYQYHHSSPSDVVQEIPDTLGTHAVLTADQQGTLILTEVISWQLHHDGSLHAMLVDSKQCRQTPVLPGDPCLYSAQDNPRFRYFFQHTIANQLKRQDPETIAAIAALVEQT